MRRSRISIKPNFRPGNRGSATGEQTSQGVAEAGETLPTNTAAEAESQPPSLQHTTPQKEPVQDVGLKNSLESSSTNLNHEEPSSGATTPAAPPQRRMRISAAPRISGPKLTSTPRTSTRKPSSVTSSLLTNQEHKQIPNPAFETQASLSKISDDQLESTTPPKLATQSFTENSSSSPCIPSTSGSQKTPVHGKKSMISSPPSPKPGQVPQQPPQEPEPDKCSLSSEDISSSCVKLTRFDDSNSPDVNGKSLDRERILRALKLKELMKLERRKDMKEGKRGVRHKEYTAMDRSKMTMRDLIYYLPNTSPMRSSVNLVEEENQETIVPCSPKMSIKTPEMEEEDEESENEEMMVPKVRVAEDGSIILDDESLTVRVQRLSKTQVENSSAQFERGSTTTYSSFRKLNHVKSWSVRETDLFFLAISMVGTDFSMIGQLLPHRSRAAIKNKFKREDRTNGWRIDKAMRNSRPFDKEFFSFLLEKVLAKDKEKGKSVKLVMKNPQKARKPRGKKAKACDEEWLSDDLDDELHAEDDGYINAEKENEDSCNVNQTENSVPAKKKRKRKDANEEKDKEESTVIRKKRKYTRKSQKETQSSKNGAEGEDDLLILEGDTVNVDDENQLESSDAAPKEKRRRSKKKENKDETPAEENKGKRRKKSLKVTQDLEVSSSANEQSTIADEEDSAAASSTVENGEAVTEADASPSGPLEAEKIDAPVTAEAVEKVPQKPGKRPKKPSPNLASKRCKKTSKPAITEADELQESQNENNESVAKATGSPLLNERLQQQAVVVLEKTPPRMKNLLSPSKSQNSNHELDSSVESPAPVGESSVGKQSRVQRVEKAKRNLTAGGKKGGTKGMMGQDEAEPGTSAEVLKSPTDLLEQMVNQESEVSLDVNLIDFSCLRDFDSQMFPKRPMVVLSREEVDKILNQDQSDDEDPSLSPLDLSINTELSFPLQCSSLMVDNNEESQVESGVEYGDRAQDVHSCCIPLEERQCEDPDLTFSALVHSDTSFLKDNSTSFKLEDVTIPENKLQASAPVVLDNVATFDQAQDYSKEHKTIPMPIPMPTSIEEESPESALVLLEVGEKSEQSAATTEFKDESQRSLQADVDTKEKLQGFSKTLNKMHESVEATSNVNEELHGSQAATFLMKEELQLSLLESSDILKESQETQVVTPEIKEGSQDPESAFYKGKKELEPSHLESSNVLKESQESQVITPEIKEGSQVSESAAYEGNKELEPSQLDSSNVLKKSQESQVVTPEIKEGSQRSESTTYERKKELEPSQLESSTVLKESQESQVKTPEIKEGSKGSESASHEEEKGLKPSPVEPSEVLKLLQESQVVTPEIKEGSRGSKLVSYEGKKELESSNVLKESQKSQVVTPEIKDASTGSWWSTLEVKKELEPSKVLKLSQESQVATPETEETSPRSVQATTEIQGGFLRAIPEVKDSQKDENLLSSSTPESSKRRSRLIKPKPNLTSRAPSLQNRGRDLQNKTREPSVSSEKPVHQAHTDGHQRVLTKEGISEAEETSRPCEVDHMESKPAKESALSGTSTALQEQKLLTASSQTTFTADEPHVDSKQTSSTSNAAPCEPVAENFQNVDTSCSSPISIQAGKHVCAPAEIIHSIEAGHDDEEPTIILTLYEIPVSEVYQDLASTDSGMTPDQVQSPRPLPEQFNSSPSTNRNDQHSGSRKAIMVTDVDDSKIIHLTNLECSPELIGAEGNDNAPENKAKSPMKAVQEETTMEAALASATFPETIRLQAKNKPSGAHGSLEGLSAESINSESECEESAEDRISCMNSSQQDEEDADPCESVSHMVLADIFVPVSMEMADVSCQDWSMSRESKLKEESSSDCPPDRQSTFYDEPTKIENYSAVNNPIITGTEDSRESPSLSKEKKAPARRRGRINKPQPKLIGKARAKDDSSRTLQPVMEQSPSASSQIMPKAQQNGALQEKTLAGISSEQDTANKKSQDNKKAASSDEPELSKERTDEKECSEKSTNTVPGETTIKEDVDSSSVHKDSSDSFHVDSEEVENTCDTVSHMVLEDLFVPVSDEMDDDGRNNWLISTDRTSHQEVSFTLNTLEDDCEKQLESTHHCKRVTEDKEQKPSSSKEAKSPSRRRGKKKICKHQVKGTDSETKEASDMVHHEETLQRVHHIIPCTVKLSKCTDILPEATEKKKDASPKEVKKATVSNSFTQSVESTKTSVLEEVKLKKPESKIKSPSRRRATNKWLLFLGKNNESSKKDPSNLVSQTRQLTIMNWAKKIPVQTATKLEDPLKTSQIQSNEKSKESSALIPVVREDQLTVDKTLTCLKSQGAEQVKGLSNLVSGSEDTDKASCSTRIQEDEEALATMQEVREAGAGQSDTQLTKPPTRRRAKLQVTPRLLKRKCAKDDNISKSDQPQPTQSTLPTCQQARTTDALKESDEPTKQHTQDVSSTSKMESNSKNKESTLMPSGPQSPKSQDLWPRVVLSRISLSPSQRGSGSDSSTPTSSPARVSTHATQTITSQVKTSPVTKQPCSPTSSENTEDDPSRVSQFFLCDIFTEVDDD
ncbi:transcription factor TFIIIB component B'' homolog [Trichomycterus rosablanca]|uniref:transcription factor TFIIIB component B'' homolog n=1 Tax=Trichomycterus rosablanca TaxID=2290929 RepID=UPI002F350533